MFSYVVYGLVVPHSFDSLGALFNSRISRYVSNIVVMLLGDKASYWYLYDAIKSLNT